MRRIELKTEGGHHVAFVEVMPFLTGPAVVMWGSRTFVCWNPKEPDVFCEAFTVVSLTPSPGLPALDLS